MSVAVLVPYRPDGGHRDTNWRWLSDRWRSLFPAWEVVVGEHAEGAWSKSAAITAALARTGADTLVITDADVWVEPVDTLITAVGLVQSGQAPWVVPHRYVRRLDRGSTRWFRAGHRTGLSLAQCAHTGIAGGGMIVVGRDGYEATGGIDPRFAGWGGEDSSWGRCADTLLGEHTRLQGTMWHLWHPPQERLDRRVGSAHNKALTDAYKAAVGDPAAMRALVEEARSWRA